MLDDFPMCGSDHDTGLGLGQAQVRLTGPSKAPDWSIFPTSPLLLVSLRDIFKNPTTKLDTYETKDIYICCQHHQRGWAPDQIALK